jgi:predicted nuclease of predicted toxin-antitoxin system
VLLEASHDVIWIGEWEKDPGDEELLRLAHQEGRVLITLDKDFGELAVVQGLPHHGIVRLVGLPAREQGDMSVQVLEIYGAELEGGAIVTVEPSRVRVRPPEDRPS